MNDRLNIAHSRTLTNNLCRRRGRQCGHISAGAYVALYVYVISIEHVYGFSDLGQANNDI